MVFSDARKVKLADQITFLMFFYPGESLRLKLYIFAAASDGKTVIK